MTLADFATRIRLAEMKRIRFRNTDACPLFNVLFSDVNIHK